MKLKLVTPARRSTDAAAEERPAPPDPKYWAFLSYSHHDKVAAKRLQKQIETYQVPRRLVGRDTAHGPVPQRLTPVFRDRDELHAGADLKASVQDALLKSRWLIVVCTPDSARSMWVNREIIEFKRMHGERRVLALIVSGEPFASDIPGRESEECFPPALRRALTAEGVAEGEPLEPIAADMRKQGDGPQRAVLKLLAGMLGVSFDDLVRRDMQRRVRLLSAVATASVFGVVVFAFMAVMAVKARNEAQHQRIQAEGLIEFMLGDLRKKLEPVGRLEVLDSVGEKALAYYGAQESDALDATALGHRSRAMHLIGEIRNLRGNPAEAQAAFEQAAATTAQLLAKTPGDARRIFDHSQSVFWVGDAAWRRGNGVTAESKFKEYLELAQRLHEMDSANPDWHAEVAFAHVQLGMVRLGTNRPADALKSLAVASSHLNELIPQRPKLVFELTQVLAWSANAYEMLGDYRRALADQQRRLALFRAMPDAAKDLSAQRNILNGLLSISRYQLALGDVDEALATSKASVEIADRLVSADAGNAYWLGDSCIAHLRMVEIDLIQSRRQDAERILAKASKCVSQVNATGSLGVAFGIRVKSRLIALTAMLSTEAQREAVVAQGKLFAKQAASELTPDVPDRANLTLEVVNAAIAVGEVQALSNMAAAMDTWSQARVLLDPYASSQNGALLTSLARICLHLGDNACAHALADKVKSSSYRHPAYAGLLNQLRAVRGS